MDETRGTARARELRWSAKGRARVVHPKYGSIVVPHHSNLAAIQNAAEYWGCDWSGITDAEVWATGPEEYKCEITADRKVGQAWKG